MGETFVFSLVQLFQLPTRLDVAGPAGVEELWCRFRSDLRVKDIAQSEQRNTRWDDGDVFV